MESVFDFFEALHQGNGWVCIGDCSKRLDDQKECLIEYFSFDLSGLGCLVAPLYYSKSPDTLTQKKRNFIRSVSELRSGELWVNGLALFQISSLSELKDIEAFFQYIRDSVIESPSFQVRLLYENRPNRLEPYVTNQGKKDLKATECLRELIDRPVVSTWLRSIAWEIKSIGRWSWVTFYKETALFTFKERNAISTAFIAYLNEKKLSVESPESANEVMVEINI